LASAPDIVKLWFEEEIFLLWKKVLVFSSIMTWVSINLSESTTLQKKIHSHVTLQISGNLVGVETKCFAD
jgi:hypothetical protein